MKTNLEEFILYGSLGWLRQNVPLSEVVSKIGTPPGQSLRQGANNPQVGKLLLSYFDLEVYVTNGLVSGLTLCAWSAKAKLPIEFDLSGFKDPENISVQEIKSLLNDHEIEWVKDEIMSDKDQLNIVSTNDVHFAFDSDKRLTRMGYAPDLRSIYFK